jgi:enoyl-CoA hydratase/carnithine racemase
VNYNSINVDASDRITTITLNRPQVLNAINPAMHAEMEHAFNAFDSDPSQYICVVTGSGERAFCAGSDLSSVFSADSLVSYPAHGYAGLSARFDLYKPVIAAVNGVCLGGGFEIALACDIIIADEQATFGFPEPRVGGIALGGGVHRLVRQIGFKQAMGYLMSCKRISAQRGAELGFVNEVAPQGTLSAAVRSWCDAILAGAPLALRATKEVAMRGLDEPSLESALKRQHLYDGFKTWVGADDTREGPRAFMEKRPPIWKAQ